MTMQENSQHWLSRAAIKIYEEILEPQGYGDFVSSGLPIVDHIVVSVGTPTSRAFNARGRNIGQCFDPQFSEDGTAQIFISPTVTDEVDVLATLQHEMLHAVCGMKAGHGPKFEAACTATGLVGPATSNAPSDEHLVKLAEIAAELGAYPHPRLDITIIPKQTTRLLKVKCINDNCPYFYNYGKPCVLRATWHAVKDATPICGHCDERMAVQMPKSQQGGGGGGGEQEREDEEFRVINPNSGGGGDGDGESGDGDSSDGESGSGEGEAGDGESSGGGESGDGDMTDAEMAEIEAEAEAAREAAGYGDVEATEQGTDGKGKGKVGRKQAATGGDGGTGKVMKGAGRVAQKPAHPVEMDCDCDNCKRGREAAGL